ncbi:MAG: hypothetical protein CMJ64_11305 [Planctomycetaceae bacterium]|nr:hypothetical protein [Planctomycetaceae bacterium]
MLNPNGKSRLKDRVYKSSDFDDLGGQLTGRWEKTDWAASSPTAFVSLIERVLNQAEVKATILLLGALDAKQDDESAES